MAEKKTDYSKMKIDKLFEEIDSITGDMENGELSLEDSFEAYKKATAMLGECKNKIDKIEKELEIISKDEC